MKTRNALIAIGVLAVALGGSIPGDAQSPAGETVLERDLDDLLTWFQGEFSNLRQVEAAATADATPPWVVARITAVDLEGLPGRQRLLELALGTAPDTVVERRAFAFFVDVAADAIVMRMLTPPAGATSRPAAGGLQPMDGCDIVWRRAGVGFLGTGNPATCRSAADNGGVPVERQMRLEGDVLQMEDRFLGDGAGPVEPPMILYRAERYVGSIRVAGRDVDRALDLHDEGGWQTFDVGSSRWRAELATRGSASAVGDTLELVVSRGDAGTTEVVASAAAPAGTRGLEIATPGVELELIRDPTASRGAVTLAEWLSGSFSSAAQAAADEAFFDIRLHMAPIWPGRDDGPWLYVEQAVATAQDQPYRQRVYRVREVEPGLYESVVYTMPDPEAAVGAWRDPQRLDRVAPADLETRTGCSILMRREGDAFIGSTLGTLCPSVLRGARYATSEVRVTRDRLVSWDRGFDASGTQVWGARSGGYVFDRITAEQPAAEPPAVPDDPTEGAER